MRRGLARALDGLALAMAYASGATFLGMALYITVDVAARRLGIYIPGTETLTAFAMAAAVSWAQMYALKAGVHVRILIVYSRLPRRLQAIFDVVELACMALLALVLSVFVWRTAFSSLETGAKTASAINAPLYVPQMLLAFGFTMLFLQSLLMIAAQVMSLPETMREPASSAPSLDADKAPGIGPL